MAGTTRTAVGLQQAMVGIGLVAEAVVFCDGLDEHAAEGGMELSSPMQNSGSLHSRKHLVFRVRSLQDKNLQSAYQAKMALNLTNFG